ncbi:MAG: tetratricopeptide repeat protein [Bacteroidia bacterium]|nr:tetratricopeptide repeat protein [Bacteroidia bacterium]
MKKFVTSILLMLISGIVSAQTLDSVFNLADGTRFMALSKHYNATYRYNTDSVFVVKELTNIESLAIQKGDKEVEASALSLLADYYARNHKFNDQSTSLHLKAIAVSKDNDLKTQEAYNMFSVGRYYYSFKHYPEAFEYFLAADRLLKVLGDEKISFAGEFYFFLASSYHKIGELDKAVLFFNQVLKFPPENFWFRLNAYNNLGVIMQQRKQYGEALQFFKQTYQLAADKNYPDWIALSIGNMGIIYFKQGLYEKALPMLQDGANINYRLKDWESTINYLYFICKVPTVKNDVASLKRNLEKANSVLQNHNTLVVKKYVLEISLLIAEQTNLDAHALNYYKQLQLVNDSLADYEVVKQMKDAQIRNEVDLRQYEIGLMITEARKDRIIKYIIIAMAFMALLFVLAMLKRETVKRRVDKALFEEKQHVLELERNNADIALASAKIELQLFTQHLQEKNQLIANYQHELSKDTTTNNSGAAERTEDIDSLHNTQILTPDDWEKFKLLYEKVHPGFFRRVKENYPQITTAEKRLLALLRLKHEQETIARILGISNDSVRKSKQRLRKKLNNIDDAELAQFANSI